MNNQFCNIPAIIVSHVGEVEVLPREHQWRLLDEYAAAVRAAEVLTGGDVSPEQRLALEAQMRIGERARKRLIVSNMRLVASIARRSVHRSAWLPLEDLVQEGVFGLNRAIEKFDRSMGTTFSTYATWWIRQSIERAIGNSGLIRVPIHAQDSAALWNSTRLNRLRQFDSVEQLMEHELRSEPADFDDWCPEQPSLPESMVCHDEAFGRIEGQELLSRAMEGLSARESDVLRRRFGFDGAPQTLEEIGQSYGVTRERIRQIEEKALERVRRLMGVRPNTDEVRDAAIESSAKGLAA